MYTVRNLLKCTSYLIVRRNYGIKSIFDVFQNFKFPTIIRPKNEIKKAVIKAEHKTENNTFWKITKVSITMFGISGIYIFFTLLPHEELDDKPFNSFCNNYYVTKKNLNRIYLEFSYYLRLIKEPGSEKLLPDPLEHPYNQPKYTLVLELSDVLVHQEWHYETGWRFKKRPLLAIFLESIHESYEIVVYTAEHGMTVFPLIEAIDPNNFIAYKLVRDATNLKRGHHVKNLENLNRDLSKVIYIDWNEKSVKPNSENLLKIKKWEGCENDRSLLDLAELLKVISDNDIEDVRDVLRYYKKYDDPLKEFCDKQQRLIEELETQAAAQRQKKPLAKSTLRKIFHM